MSLRKNKREIERLIVAFESEASKFHDLTFGIFTTRKEGKLRRQNFKTPHHAIMLWQYYGKLGSEQDRENLVKNLQGSHMKWGVRGAKISSYGIIEGAATDLFVRMAKRAGSFFSDAESRKIKHRMLEPIFKVEQDGCSKPHGITNDNPFAVWLNYLLYYISETNPGRENLTRIEPDPFTLSLLALEQLLEKLSIGKSDRSLSKVQDIKFKVALSFPGEKRTYVSKVADSLRRTFGKDKVFYDYDYQSQLAVPNLDVLLQTLYRDNSELVVVFLCAEYAKKEWCGLEWRAIREIIKSKESERIMFVRFDDAKVDGTFSIDGYIDGQLHNPREVVKFIKQRLALSSTD